MTQPQNLLTLTQASSHYAWTEADTAYCKKISRGGCIAWRLTKTTKFTHLSKEFNDPRKAFVLQWHSLHHKISILGSTYLAKYWGLLNLPSLHNTAPLLAQIWRGLW